MFFSSQATRHKLQPVFQDLCSLRNLQFGLRNCPFHNTPHKTIVLDIRPQWCVQTEFLCWATVSFTQLPDATWMAEPALLHILGFCHISYRDFFSSFLHLFAFLGLSKTWFKALVPWLPQTTAEMPDSHSYCLLFTPSLLCFSHSTPWKSNYLSLFYLPESSASFSPIFFSILSSPFLRRPDFSFHMTVSLALVFHSLTLNSCIVVSFQFSYWLPELFSPVSTKALHNLQSLLAFLPCISFFPVLQVLEWNPVFYQVL